MAGPLWILAAFLLGAVPFGYFIGRAAGVDVRRVGSGNIGAGNLLRTVGPSAALFTLLLDVGKGALPVAAARWLGQSPEWLAAVVGAAVVGHVYSPFLGFRGGKGVATALGGLAVGSPPLAAAAVGVWAVTAGASRFASLGAVVACLLLPVFAWWLDGRPAFEVLAGGLSALVLWRHRGNIARLWRGTEPRIGHRMPAVRTRPSS